jgi:hypothetical protein
MDASGQCRYAASHTHWRRGGGTVEELRQKVNRVTRILNLERIDEIIRSLPPLEQEKYIVFVHQKLFQAGQNIPRDSLPLLMLVHVRYFPRAIGNKPPEGKSSSSLVPSHDRDPDRRLP